MLFVSLLKVAPPPPSPPPPPALHLSSYPPTSSHSVMLIATMRPQAPNKINDVFRVARSRLRVSAGPGLAWEMQRRPLLEECKNYIWTRPDGDKQLNWGKYKEYIFLYLYKSRSPIPHIYLLSGRIQEKNHLSKNVKKGVKIPIP